MSTVRHPFASIAVVTFALGMALAFPARSQAQCAGTKALFQFGSSDYIRCGTSTDYNTALTACQGVYPGWHLATFSNMAEQDYLWANRGGTQRWIGLNDIAVEGTYIWVDGTIYGTYTSWRPGSPTGAATDCVRIVNGTNTWQDQLCTNNNQFWCEGPTTCGNGFKTSTEGCDDGNTSNGDGCDSTCTVEAGWYCSQVGGQNYNLTTCTAGCTSAGVAGSNSGSSYLYCPVVSTWSNAQTACRLLGAGWDLTSIGSAAENTYVNTLATAAAYIGLNDIALENFFVWSNGAMVPYYNWAAGNPDDAPAPGDCVIMNNNGTGTWSDQACATATRYICEGPNTCGDGAVTGSEACDDGNGTNGDGCDAACVVETNWACVGSPSVCHPTCSSPSWGWKQYNATTWTEYYYCKQSRNWTSAKAVCDNLGPNWHLVTINNATENAFIGSLANVSKWTGLSDQAVEGTFAWDDGSPLAYTNWYTGNPNGGATIDCVRQYPSAQTNRWDDIICTTAYTFVCEGGAVVCGNGVVGNPEECDDGNTTDGDGCSSACTVEPHYGCALPDFDGVPASVCSQPMRVSVADVAIVQSAAGLALEWDTTSEAGTLGFVVSRRMGPNDKWTTVHDEMLIGLQDAPQGGRYQLRLANASTNAEYRIEEVTRSGRTMAWSGKARVERNGARAMRLDADGFAAAQRVIPVSNGLSTIIKAQRPGAAGKFQLRAGRVPSGAVIHVAHAGVQSVPVADLAAALGASTNTVVTALNQSKLSLTDGATSVHWQYDAGAEVVRFLGSDADSIYAATRPYMAKLTSGAVMNVLDESTESAASAGTGLVTTNVEQDLFAGTVVSPDPESDYWFWGVLSAGSAMQKQFSADLELDGVPTADATLEVRLYGAWDMDAARGQNVQVLVNGHSAGSFLVDDLGPKSADVTVQAAWLVAGTNTVTLKASWAGEHGGGMYVDGVTLVSRQVLSTPKASLSFTATASTSVGVEVIGTEPSVYDLTTDERILPSITTLDGGAVRVAFSSEANHKYLVAAKGADAAPTLRASYDAGLLTTAFDVDYLVVTPSELRAQADRLAGLRNAQGMTTLVVELNDIYDAFAAGLPTPHAIKAFFEHTGTAWSATPTCAVLLGDGSMDYRGIKGATAGIVPPLLVKTAYGLYASDSVLGDVNHDGVPEITVGRLPVRTDVDADRVIDRIAAYEAGTLDVFETTAILLSGEDRGGNFSQQNQDLVESFPVDLELASISATPAKAAAIHTSLLYLLNRGTFWFNYLGHGGMTNLDDSNVLTVDAVPALTNAAALPIVTGMTCNLARFEVPGFDSLGDALLLGETGGAIAVWGASGITQSRDASGVSARFGNLLINEGSATKHRARLGDLVAQTHNEALADGDIDADQIGTFVLLGDPALRLPDLSSLDPENLQSVDPTDTEEVPATGDGGVPSATGDGSSKSGGLCAMNVGASAPSSATWLLFLAAAVLVVVRRRRK